ncbi:hypothetical protein [Chryseobacterium sp.]|nr:hypothetical protein [Chryseobacterium sp.]
MKKRTVRAQKHEISHPACPETVQEIPYGKVVKKIPALPNRDFWD